MNQWINKDTEIYCSFAETAGNTGCQMMNSAFYYYGLNKLPASYTTLFELFWPLSAVVIDWLIRGKPLSFAQLLGAVILLTSMTVLTQENSNERSQSQRP